MTDPTQDPNYDPLQSFDSVPAVSFDPSKEGGIPENTWAELVVTDYIKLVQDKDDKTGRPAVYEDSGKPVWKSVLPVEKDGEARSLWAKKNWVQGGLFRALADAQKALGTRIGPGTVIRVRWAWDTTKEKKLGNYPKKYQVEATAGQAPPPSADPLHSPVEVGQAPVDPWSLPPVTGDAPPF